MLQVPGPVRSLKNVELVRVRENSRKLAPRACALRGIANYEAFDALRRIFIALTQIKRNSIKSSFPKSMQTLEIVILKGGNSRFRKRRRHSGSASADRAPQKASVRGVRSWCSPRHACSLRRMWSQVHANEHWKYVSHQQNSYSGMQIIINDKHEISTILGRYSETLIQFIFVIIWQHIFKVSFFVSGWRCENRPQRHVHRLHGIHRENLSRSGENFDFRNCFYFRQLLSGKTSAFIRIGSNQVCLCGLWRFQHLRHFSDYWYAEILFFLSIHTNRVCIFIYQIFLKSKMLKNVIFSKKKIVREHFRPSSDLHECAHDVWFRQSECHALDRRCQGIRWEDSRWRLHQYQFGRIF